MNVSRRGSPKKQTRNCTRYWELCSGLPHLIYRHSTSMVLDESLPRGCIFFCIFMRENPIELSSNILFKPLNVGLN